jgi:hypothetical protein
MCEAWFLVNIIEFATVAASAKSLVVEIHVGPAARDRYNVIRCRIAVASFSAVLALVLVAFEHDEAAYAFEGRKKMLGAPNSAANCLFISPEPIQALLAHRSANNCVAACMGTALAGCFAFLAALLPCVQTRLTIFTIRNRVSVWMVRALAGCEKTRTTLLIR